jgi:acetyl esterase/lipase
MASDAFHAIVGWLRENPVLPDAEAVELRAAMESSISDEPPQGASVTPADANGVPGEWVVADTATRDAVLLYLHGGGYCIGSPRTHRGLAARVSREAGAAVLLLDYRLAPEHPHPAAVDDAVAAYRFLLDRHDPSRVAIAGDSAGGGLTFTTLVAARDRGLPMPAAAAAISPWADLECNSETYATRGDLDPMCTAAGLKRMADWFVAGGDPRDPLVSPVHADLAGLPPLLVHVGDHEVLLDDSRRLADNAASAGVDVTLEVWPEMVHVWHAFAGMVPEADDAVARLGAFMRNHMAR